MLKNAKRGFWGLMMAGLLALATLAGPVPASANDEMASMENLVKWALDHDASYRSAEIAVQQAQTTVKLKLAGRLPHAGVQVTAGLPATSDMAGQILTFSVSQSFSIPGLSLFGSNAVSEVETAMWDLGNAVLERDQEKLDVASEVYRQVIGVLVDREVLENAKNALTVAEDGLKRTLRTLELGTATKVDELNYQTSVLSAKANVATAEENLKTALRDLESLIGKPVSPEALPVEFVPKPHEIPMDGLAPMREKALVLSTAVSLRTIALKKAERSLALLRNEYRPQITLNAGADTTGASAAATLNLTTGEISWNAGVLPGQWIFPGSSTPGAGGSSDGASVNVKIYWNFFDGGAGRLQIAKSQQDIQLAQIALDEAKRAVGDGLATAASAVNSSYRKWQSSEEKLTLTREKLRLCQVRFDLGVEGVADLIAAEEDLAEALAATAQARYNWTLAVLALERAAGLSPLASRW